MYQRMRWPDQERRPPTLWREGTGQVGEVERAGEFSTPGRARGHQATARRLCTNVSVGWGLHSGVCTAQGPGGARYKRSYCTLQPKDGKVSVASRAGCSLLSTSPSCSSEDKGLQSSALGVLPHGALVNTA